MNATSPEPHEHQHAMPHPADVSVAGHDEHGMTGQVGHGEPGVHDRHAGHSVAMFRDKFSITLLLSIPTLFSAPPSTPTVGWCSSRADCKSCATESPG